MLKVGMYVRCPVDAEDMEQPRDFALAKVMQINTFAETVCVHFYDCRGIREYYKMPEEYEYPARVLQHAVIHKQAIVRYLGTEYTVQACAGKNQDEFYEYYISALKTDAVIRVSEQKLEASFQDSEIDPIYQMLNYEFQNPVWYFGRRSVSRTVHSIENAIRGFKELSGCKIFLKPYQLKTVMRCLSQQPCRNMIADEVGLGKTIEAASVLKIYMTDRHKARIVIIVPDALTEQWRTELAFKFNLFEQPDRNGNRIQIVPFSRMSSVRSDSTVDFLIVDEVHQCLQNKTYYTLILEMSRRAVNVLMLSATPVQDRKEEFYHLLCLIQPKKYSTMPSDTFSHMLEQQSKIVRNVYEALGSFEDYREEIEGADGELSEDAQDIFDDELTESFEKINRLIQDDRFEKTVQSIDIHSDDHGIARIQRAIAYVCEHYQLEHCIIRNRRSVLDNDTKNERELVSLPLSLSHAYNNTQLQLYRKLSDYIEEKLGSYESFLQFGKTLISAFFSSAAAFCEELSLTRSDVPEDIRELAKRWQGEEIREIKQISSVMESPYDYPSRLVSILDYIDQEAYDKKVLLFTSFPKTYEVYQQAFSAFYPDQCCFFRRGMNSETLELQAYRFQTEKQYRIMLSDESGGEGRNFQNADIVIHIDLPWNANTLEQRIGRLDRIGRQGGRPVVSVVPYVEETLEEDLLHVWSEGLRIFVESQSGLEIIMNEIDEKILRSVSEDLKYGLSNMLPQLMEDMEKLKKTVKLEQHFDTAAYQYQSLNQQLDRAVREYTSNETELFAASMMNWAERTGFKGRQISDNVIRFDRSSFSPGSAMRTHFVPPDMQAEITNRLNQLQNRIRLLNGERGIEQNPYFIQGTFDRSLALSNDYLHFFAPGDAIFDSIVQNALYSYRGRCAAIAVPSSFPWNGVFFTWQLRPNISILLENGIDVRMLGEYLGYLPGKQIINAAVWDSGEIETDDRVMRCFSSLEHLTTSQIKNNAEHLGKRRRSSPILGINEKYGCSDLEWFLQEYPRDRWRPFVKDSYHRAKEDALQKLKKLTRVNAMKNALLGAASSQQAVQAFFSQETENDSIQQINELLLKAMLNPIIELDSVCFVRMVDVTS